MATDAFKPFELGDIENALQSLNGRVIETPVVQLNSERMAEYLPRDADIRMKLELMQHAGSFKARGALLNIDQLDDEQRANGVTAVSAGNHALAVSWAAKVAGITAKVVMPNTADPMRIAGCDRLGAEVVRVEDVHQAFDEVERIEREEGRFYIHPFEGPVTAMGTATCGLEFIRQVPDMEVAVIPIGGGGLIAGMAQAIKIVNPDCRVIGVEPVGADSMTRSFRSGRPMEIEKVTTIADSLGAPKALPYSFAAAKAFVDDIVLIDDDRMRKAMALLFNSLKIAAEPAGAATTAALMGPLKQTVAGKRVGIICCGSNIGAASFAKFVVSGMSLMAKEKNK